MNWQIQITNQVSKQIEKLPKAIKTILFLLVRDLEQSGPSTGAPGKTMENSKA